MIEETKVMISEADIRKKVSELAKQIEKDYQDREITIICVLKGSFIFCADLVRQINGNVKIEFIKASSYGMNTESSGEVEFKYSTLTSVEGKNLLIVEDIIDTGITLDGLTEYYRNQGATDVKICALLDKYERRIKDVYVDYIGFKIEDKFVVGYGLDCGEEFREKAEILEVISLKKKCE